MPPNADMFVSNPASGLPSGPFGLDSPLAPNETLPDTSEKVTVLAPCGTGTLTGSTPPPSPPGSGAVFNPAPQMLSVAETVNSSALLVPDAFAGPAAPAVEVSGRSATLPNKTSDPASEARRRLI